jgi:hypothetical protein
MVATTDLVVAAVGVTAAGAFIFREQLFGGGKPKAAIAMADTGASDESSRDFVAKLKATVRDPARVGLSDMTNIPHRTSA